MENKNLGNLHIPENIEIAFGNLPTVEVEQGRFEELIKKEERLHTIETALKALDFYNSDFELFKNIFGLKEVK